MDLQEKINFAHKSMIVYSFREWIINWCKWWLFSVITSTSFPKRGNLKDNDLIMTENLGHDAFACRPEGLQI